MNPALLDKGVAIALAVLVIERLFNLVSFLIKRNDVEREMEAKESTRQEIKSLKRYCEGAKSLAIENLNINKKAATLLGDVPVGYVAQEIKREVEELSDALRCLCKKVQASREKIIETINQKG